MELIDLDDDRHFYIHDDADGYEVWNINRDATVEAIPIEWIEEYFNRNYLSEYYHNAVMFFAEMKKDWQKEQEKQNDNN